MPDDAREPVSMSGMAEGGFGCKKQLSNGTMCQREPCAGDRRWALRRASQGTPDKPKEPQPQSNEKGKGKGSESSKRNLEEEMNEEEEDSRGSRGRSQGRRGETSRDHGRSKSRGRSKVSMAGRRRIRREEGNANRGVTSLHITSHNSTHHPASTRLKPLHALPLYTPLYPHHPPIYFPLLPYRPPPHLSTTPPLHHLTPPSPHLSITPPLHHLTSPIPYSSTTSLIHHLTPI